MFKVQKNSEEELACRIRNEADHILLVQAKTFTKALNVLLDGEKIEDIFLDLRSGKKLIKIIRYFSGENMESERGSSMFHTRSNIQLCLDTLEKNKVEFVNIHVDDIMEGNKKITLGLIWTILHHYQLGNDIPVIGNLPQAQPYDFLLNWVNNFTREYDVTVRNFTSSWADGKVLCAILIQFKYIKLTWAKIGELEIEDRLRLALTIAEIELAVHNILDVDDIMLNPDSKSIQLYVSYLYKALSNETHIKHSKMMSLVNDTCRKIQNLVIEFQAISITPCRSYIVGHAMPEIKYDITQSKWDWICLMLKEVDGIKLVVEDLDNNYQSTEVENTIALFDNLSELSTNTYTTIVLMLTKLQKEITENWFIFIYEVGHNIEQLKQLKVPVMPTETRKIFRKAVRLVRKTKDKQSELSKEKRIDQNILSDIKDLFKIVLNAASQLSIILQVCIACQKAFVETESKLHVSFESSILYEFNEISYELIQLLDPSKDIEFIELIESRVEYWFSVANKHNHMNKEDVNDNSNKKYVPIRYVEHGSRTSSSSSENSSFDSSDSPIPSDMDELMMSEKYDGTSLSLDGLKKNDFVLDIEDYECSLAQLGGFDPVSRTRVLLRPMVSLVREETEEEVRAMESKRPSAVSDQSLGGSTCQKDFEPAQIKNEKNSQSEFSSSDMEEEICVNADLSTTKTNHSRSAENINIENAPAKTETFSDCISEDESAKYVAYEHGVSTPEANYHDLTCVMSTSTNEICRNVSIGKTGQLLLEEPFSNEKVELTNQSEIECQPSFELDSAEFKTMLSHASHHDINRESDTIMTNAEGISTFGYPTTTATQMCWVKEVSADDPDNTTCRVKETMTRNVTGNFMHTVATDAGGDRIQISGGPTNDSPEGVIDSVTTCVSKQTIHAREEIYEKISETTTRSGDVCATASSSSGEVVTEYLTGILGEHIESEKVINSISIEGTSSGNSLFKSLSDEPISAHVISNFGVPQIELNSLDSGTTVSQGATQTVGETFTSVCTAESKIKSVLLFTEDEIIAVGETVSPTQDTNENNSETGDATIDAEATATAALYRGDIAAPEVGPDATISIESKITGFEGHPEATTSTEEITAHSAMGDSMLDDTGTVEADKHIVTTESEPQLPSTTEGETKIEKMTVFEDQSEISSNVTEDLVSPVVFVEAENRIIYCTESKFKAAALTGGEIEAEKATVSEDQPVTEAVGESTGAFVCGTLCSATVLVVADNKKIGVVAESEAGAVASTEDEGEREKANASTVVSSISVDADNQSVETVAHISATPMEADAETEVTSVSTVVAPVSVDADNQSMETVAPIAAPPIEAEDKTEVANVSIVVAPISVDADNQSADTATSIAAPPIEAEDKTEMTTVGENQHETQITTEGKTSSSILCETLVLPTVSVEDVDGGNIVAETEAEEVGPVEDQTDIEEVNVAEDKWETEGGLRKVTNEVETEGELLKMKTEGETTSCVAGEAFVSAAILVQADNRSDIVVESQLEETSPSDCAAESVHLIVADNDPITTISTGPEANAVDIVTNAGAQGEITIETEGENRNNDAEEGDGVATTSGEWETGKHVRKLHEESALNVEAEDKTEISAVSNDYSEAAEFSGSEHNLAKVKTATITSIEVENLHGMTLEYHDTMEFQTASGVMNGITTQRHDLLTELTDTNTIPQESEPVNIIQVESENVTQVEFQGENENQTTSEDLAAVDAPFELQVQAKSSGEGDPVSDTTSKLPSDGMPPDEGENMNEITASTETESVAVSTATVTLEQALAEFDLVTQAEVFTTSICNDVCQSVEIEAVKDAEEEDNSTAEVVETITVDRDDTAMCDEGGVKTYQTTSIVSQMPSIGEALQITTGVTENVIERTASDEEVRDSEIITHSTEYITKETTITTTTYKTETIISDVTETIISDVTETVSSERRNGSDENMADGVSETADDFTSSTLTTSAYTNQILTANIFGEALQRNTDIQSEMNSDGIQYEVQKDGEEATISDQINATFSAENKVTGAGKSEVAEVSAEGDVVESEVELIKITKIGPETASVAETFTETLIETDMVIESVVEDALTSEETSTATETTAMEVSTNATDTESNGTEELEILKLTVPGSEAAIDAAAKHTAGSSSALDMSSDVAVDHTEGMRTDTIETVDNISHDIVVTDAENVSRVESQAASVCIIKTITIEDARETIVEKGLVTTVSDEAVDSSSTVDSVGQNINHAKSEVEYLTAITADTVEEETGEITLVTDVVCETLEQREKIIDADYVTTSVEEIKSEDIGTNQNQVSEVVEIVTEHKVQEESRGEPPSIISVHTLHSMYETSETVVSTKILTSVKETEYKASPSTDVSLHNVSLKNNEEAKQESVTASSMEHTNKTNFVARTGWEGWEDEDEWKDIIPEKANESRVHVVKMERLVKRNSASDHVESTDTENEYETARETQLASTTTGSVTENEAFYSADEEVSESCEVITQVDSETPRNSPIIMESTIENLLAETEIEPSRNSLDYLNDLSGDVCTENFPAHQFTNISIEKTAEYNVSCKQTVTSIETQVEQENVEMKEEPVSSKLSSEGPTKIEVNIERRPSTGQLVIESVCECVSSNDKQEISSILAQIEEAEFWLAGMSADFGKDELEYSKRKAEDDLEQLEASWKILDNLEKTSHEEDVRSSAAECKQRLNDALEKLRDFIKELTVAIEYEEKQNFLLNWLRQCEISISNEPCKITVRDELEVNIQKYYELSRVINDKKESIREVIECGKDLALKANSRVDYYKEGVEVLDSEWFRVTSLVDERKSKLDSWNASFIRYEEARGCAVRSKEDIEAKIAKLELELIEEVNLEDTPAELEELNGYIISVINVSEEVLAEFQGLAKTQERDEYKNSVTENIENLQCYVKSFEKRIQIIQSNKVLVLKLREKLDALNRYIQKGTTLLESESTIQDQSRLDNEINEYNILLIELDDLQVQTKIISDWSIELSKGPNPSASVDEAQCIEERLSNTRKQLENRRTALEDLQITWMEMEAVIISLEHRVENINYYVKDIYDDPNQEKIILLNGELDQELIEEQVNQVKTYGRAFSSANVMKDYIEERIQVLGASIQKCVEDGFAVRRQVKESENEAENVAITSWIEGSQTSVESVTDIQELTLMTDQLQLYANKISSDNDLQVKLLELDAQIRRRKEHMEAAAQAESTLANEMRKNIQILSEMEANNESAFERPAEYFVAKNLFELISVEQCGRSDLYQQFETLINRVIYPKNTINRVNAVEIDLDRAELELSKTEVHKVDLTGNSILEAREAVIKIYEVLIDVKNNLEDLIKIKRELQKNNFLDAEAEFSTKLINLRERFNATGDRITQNKATLSKSLRRVNKLKKAVEETDAWAFEVLKKLGECSYDESCRMEMDAQTRSREINEATNDCVNKIRTQLSADTTDLENDVNNRLISVSKLIRGSMEADENMPTATAKQNEWVESTQDALSVKEVNIKLSNVEVELLDKSFGVSNPRYIQRQGDVLSKAKIDLDEVEKYLVSHSNTESSQLQAYIVATRKFEFLKGKYHQNENEVNQIKLIWNEFDKSSQELVSQLENDKMNSNYESIEFREIELNRLKEQLQQAPELLVSPRGTSFDSEKYINQAQTLVNELSFERDQNFTIVKDTEVNLHAEADEQVVRADLQNSEVQKAIVDLETWSKTTNLAYGSHESISKAVATLASYKMILDGSFQEDGENNQSTTLQYHIEEKENEIDLVKQSTKKIERIRSHLVAQIETANQLQEALNSRSNEPTEDLEQLLEEYQELSYAISQIEAKQAEIIAEGEATNKKYGMAYSVDSEVACNKLIKELDTKVLTAQEKLHTRIGNMKKVKAAITQIEEKLNEFPKQLDLDELNTEDLQYMETELLSHRAGLDKLSSDVVSVNLEDDFKRVEHRWCFMLDRVYAMRQRIQLDITRWRNLAAQLEELAAWISSREPKLEELNAINLDSRVLNQRANECGILMVEIEAKSSAIEQTLSSANEAMNGYKSVDLKDIELPTRAVLENLRDREEETRKKWTIIQEQVSEWKNQIYQKFEVANKLDENVKVIVELCDKSEKEALTVEEFDAGDVFVQDVEKKLVTNGVVPAEIVNYVTDVVTRWTHIKASVRKEETGTGSGRKSRPTSVVMAEPDKFEPVFQPEQELPKTPAKQTTCNSDKTSLSQLHLQSSVSQNWERQETEYGIPYYINHATETTTWNHPKLSDLTAGLKTLNLVKFSAYRTAMKLRKLQKTLALDYFKIDHMQKAFRSFNVDQTSSVQVIDLAEMLYEIYQHSSNQAQQADLTLNLLLNIFDPGREGKIPLLCIKTGLVALCGAQIEEKYRYLFTAASGANKTMSKSDLKALVYSWVQIPHYLGESRAFGGIQTEATVDSAFEYSTSKSQIQMSEFLKWASLEPQSIVWLPVMHRLISAQSSQHNVKCVCCKQMGFNGFRYRSLKHFSHDLCHQCFLYGRASEEKLVQYPLVEYHNQSGKGENMRDVIRTLKYKMSLRKRKRPVLGYLPINASLDNGDGQNNSVNATKTSTSSNKSDSLYIPQSPSTPLDSPISPITNKPVEAENNKILEHSQVNWNEVENSQQQ